MASWRDEVSEQGQAVLDALLQQVLPFAEQMLGEYGEFFPYGAVVSRDLDLEMVAADPGEGEQPDAEAVLRLLYEQLAARADGLDATAVVSDVRLRDPAGDAVRIELEHREGVAIAVLFRYELDGDGGVAFAAPTAVPGERRTWPG